jgi:hypothetical protein
MKHLICIPFVLPVLGLAQPTLYARCSEPQGTRFDQVEGEVRQQLDGFAGVNPTFIITKEAPAKLSFLWGPADWARDSLQIQQRIQDAAIIDVTPEKVTAIRVDSGGVTQMYSLYPEMGIVYFTQHRFIMGSVPSASTFHARCEFTK